MVRLTSFWTIFDGQSACRDHVEIHVEIEFLQNATFDSPQGSQERSRCSLSTVLGFETLVHLDEKMPQNHYSSFTHFLLTPPFWSFSSIVGTASLATRFG